MLNKRGLSAIVATIIIIAITLIGVGIVMYVVMPLFTDTAQDVEYANKCLNSNIEITKIDSLTVYLKRTTGNEEFTGVKLIARDGNGVSVGTGTYTGNINTLSVVTATLSSVTGATKVDAVVYFTKEDGTQHLCAQGASKDI